MISIVSGHTRSLTVIVYTLLIVVGDEGCILEVSCVISSALLLLHVSLNRLFS